MVLQQHVKDQDIQTLQSTVQRLETDVFDDIDTDDTHTQSDANLHIQPWRPVVLSSTLFSTHTPVLTLRVSSPDTPHPQQHFSSVIDKDTELVILQKQIQELNHRMLVMQEINHRMSVKSTHQPAPPPSMTHDVTVSLIPAFKTLVDEIKHIRNSEDVKITSEIFQGCYGTGTH